MPSGYSLYSFGRYTTFGSPMPSRSFSASSYRYGFNGQEKDDEVAGNGNINTAMYWEYDSRLGRRWNIDQIVKIHESPYAVFGNNPIIMLDPNGANAGVEKDKDKKTATITANVFLVKGNTTQAEFDGYVANYKTKIDGTWGEKSFKDADGTNYKTKTNINVQSFNSQSDLDTYMKNNAVNKDITNVLNVGTSDGTTTSSHVNPDGNTGFMNVNGLGDAHEFGHLLGLSDRYQNFVSINPNSALEYRNGKTSGSVPSIFDKSFDERYYHNRDGNLMTNANAGTVITDKQFSFIFSHFTNVTPGTQGYEPIPFPGAQLYFTTVRNPFGGLKPGNKTTLLITTPSLVTPGSTNSLIKNNYKTAASLYGR